MKRDETMKATLLFLRGLVKFIKEKEKIHQILRIIMLDKSSTFSVKIAKEDMKSRI